MRGSVRRFDPVRRFGTIRGLEDGFEYFVHVNELIDVLHLVPGQRVTFTPTWTEKGLAAVGVRPLESVR
jgi:cold shock CspA family protein